MKTLAFDIEASPAKAGQPNVLFTRRIEGASRRVDVRLPQPLRDRLRRHAPECHTIAVMALAQRGLLQLMERKQRLVSQWVPDARGGQFRHAFEPVMRGQPHVECSSIPTCTKAGGRTPTVFISIPDVLHDALRTEARHVSNALAALADWQLTMLHEGRQRITVTPLRPPKPSRT